jgi:hypothetical protein
MNENLPRWESTRDQFILEAIKANLSLSSGTFIVSLGYLAQEQSFEWKSLIYMSWLSVLLSIIFGLLSIEVGAKRYDVAIKGTTGQLMGDRKELYSKGNVLRWYEAITPDIQRWAFYIGLFTFFAFVVINSAGKFK